MLAIALTNGSSKFMKYLCKTQFSAANYFKNKGCRLISNKSISTVIFTKSKLLNTLRINSELNFKKNSCRQIISDAIPGKIVKSKKIVGYWLLGCSGMVMVAVVLGGLTRLTESGLSMVTWRLLGETVPTSNEEWVEEFKRYQQYPEYKLLRRDITLQEFKWIWWMEYIHRTWGRFIGVAFFLPALGFWFKGYLTSALKKRVSIFGLLIAAQGVLGWYMVKSGLEDRFYKETDIPRVSQYRLAAHLGLAFTLYSALLWSALDLLLPLQKIVSSNTTKKLKIMTYFSKGLIFITVLSGALVAGLDAGLVYNSFPKMGEKWIPDDILSFSPKIINFVENPTTVQFDHRLLGVTTLFLITTLWVLSCKCQLPPRTKLAVNALTVMGLTQVFLGISTLIYYVPTYLAVSHQAGSLVLLSFAVWLSHELKYLKYMPK